MRTAILILPLALAGCAQQQARVIEPKVSAGAGPSSGGSDGAGPAPNADDSGFTLSRTPTKMRAPASPADYPIHLAEKWYPFRAEYLSISVPEANDRDAALPEAAAPAKFWDEQTAIEAVSLWGALCNECHGGRRRLQEALSMPPPPNSWGKGEGLFFGKRRAYADIFKVISGGGPNRNGKPSEMPAWRPRLSKEVVWSLIYFLEYQSGGIEGVFPPSLYPRPLDNNE